MRFSSRLLVFLSVFLFSVVNTAPVFAQRPGQGLEISPPLIERSVDPGQSLTLNIKLRNITKSALVTTGSVDDFVAQGEEGHAPPGMGDVSLFGNGDGAARQVL